MALGVVGVEACWGALAGWVVVLAAGVLVVEVVVWEAAWAVELAVEVDTV